MSTESSARKMRLIRGAGNKDAQIARLQQELEELQARLEEVTSYYRGELESSQQRLEQEAVRSQANEVARRRRAEEQVAYLQGELKAAQSEAEHAKRRYQDLSSQLEALERSAEQQARAEVDRFREAASTAWKSAEEEVARLDAEVSEAQRRIAQEQARRRQLEESLRREKENAAREQEKRKQVQLSARQAVDKLRRALKASEQRRKQLDRNLEEQRAAGIAQQASAAQQAAMARSEEQLRAVYADLQHTERTSAAPSKRRLPDSDNTVYVDLASIDLGSALQGELSEEFMLLPSDDSIYGSGESSASGVAASAEEAEFVVETEEPEPPASPEPVEQAAPPSSADGGQKGRAPGESVPQAPPPPRELGEAFGSGRPHRYAVAAAVAVVCLGGLAYLVL